MHIDSRDMDTEPSIPLLSLKDVGFAYGGAQALSGVSLEVHRGEVVALLGANGAGKSTTAKLTAGALNPRQGAILFQGSSINGLPAHRVCRLGIALVPEGRLVFPQMSVEENLLMGAFKSPDRVRVRELLEENFMLFPRLKERRAQAAGSLSGGEQQMVAIARGLMSEPQLLIMDEPSLGLMPKLVMEMFDLIDGIRRRGVSVLLIEQNAASSLRVADRAYVLEKGRVLREGASRELLEDDFVRAAYLGLN